MRKFMQPLILALLLTLLVSPFAAAQDSAFYQLVVVDRGPTLDSPATLWIVSPEAGSYAKVRWVAKDPTTGAITRGKLSDLQMPAWSHYVHDIWLPANVIKVNVRIFYPSGKLYSYRGFSTATGTLSKLTLAQCFNNKLKLKRAETVPELEGSTDLNLQVKVRPCLGHTVITNDADELLNPFDVDGNYTIFTHDTATVTFKVEFDTEVLYTRTFPVAKYPPSAYTICNVMQVTPTEVTLQANQEGFFDIGNVGDEELPEESLTALPLDVNMSPGQVYTTSYFVTTEFGVVLCFHPTTDHFEVQETYFSIEEQ